MYYKRQQRLYEVELPMQGFREEVVNLTEWFDEEDFGQAIDKIKTNYKDAWKRLQVEERFIYINEQDQTIRTIQLNTERIHKIIHNYVPEDYNDFQQFIKSQYDNHSTSQYQTFNLPQKIWEQYKLWCVNYDVDTSDKI